MSMIKIIRGAAAFVAGVIITLVCLTAALVCRGLGWPANWAAKWWGWLGYWVELRCLVGVKVVSRFGGELPADDQPVVQFGTHPLDPALQAWVYDTNRQFPGRHFAPTARDNHPLSPGFRAIGGVILPSGNGPTALRTIRESLAQHPDRLLVSIFPDVHRWNPKWHKKLWSGKAASWGHSRRNYTLPWREGGLREIHRALPQAAYYRTVVCFNRPAWGWRGFFQVSGSTLLIHRARVFPPLNPLQFQPWLNKQAEEADRITGEFQVS